MSPGLKERILDLLERDREFRYAVAGLIGLDKILKRLDRHDEKFNEILIVLKRHTAILEEHTVKLEEHDRKFNEILTVLKEHTARLEEHDRKFNEILTVLKEHTARLEEHDRKFNEVIARLDAHDEKFNEIMAEIRDIRRELREIRSYMDRTSLTLEEEAWEVVSGRLRRMGVDVRLTRLILPSLEVNIYGAAGDLCIVGEASTRAGARIVRSIDEKLNMLRERYPEHLRRRVLKVVYTMWATDDAVEEAKRRGVWLLRALEELTKPNL